MSGSKEVKRECEVEGGAGRERGRAALIAGFLMQRG